jgi:hypothetical protein
MILTKNIVIKPNSKTLSYYKELGYDCAIHTELNVSVEHLTKGSHQIIDVKCDFCGIEKKLNYNSYWRNTKHLTEPYSCSEKCGLEKRNITNIEKYGVENVFKNNEIKDKIKKSYINNLGVEHPSKSIEIQNKIKNKILEKFGINNYNNKEKRENTCLKKYGVRNPFQNEKSYETKKNKILEKYKKYGLINIKNKKYILVCNKGHYVELDKNIFHNRLKLKTILCTICNPIGDYHRSGLETELSDFIKINYNGLFNLNKKFNNQELDIYLPSLNLAFEFNGVYWHNELNKENNYHLNKTNFFEKQNIKLIQIYEDDWLYKKDIIKSRILNLLGKSDRIFARKCEIKEINDNNIVREFLEQNHLQGFIGSKIKIGLFYNDELVSLMTFGNLRKSLGQKSTENSYEMLRFCNKLNTNIIGGASKLFKYFLEKYNPKEIISYADRSWSTGDLYEKLGFKFIHKTNPNYYYVIDRKRYHRFNFRKNKLIKDGANPNKTEHEIMLEKGIFRIYDSGSLKYQFISY